jgi:hypothetical protein
MINLLKSTQPPVPTFLKGGEGGLSGPEGLLDFFQVFGNGDPVGTPRQALLTGGTRSCLHRELAILLNGPFFHPVAFIIAFDAKDVWDGNLLRARKAVATISAESFADFTHPIHEVIDFLRG